MINLETFNPYRLKSVCHKLSYIIAANLLLGASSYAMDSTPAPAKRPNVLLIVADDLGMFDIGAYGSEIKTPNIDQLAKQGVTFTDFHTSATCSPTRSMLLTGVDSHTAGLGNMIEHVAPNQKGQTGYEGHLSNRAVSIATLLQDEGYATYMAGKWHLGMKPELLPANKGFDESFVLLQGGGSYFNDMKGLVSVVPDAHYRHNKQEVTELPDDFYATEFYTDFIIENIKKNEKEKPFFAYLAFSAPHWPLQVKDEHIDLYKGRYDEGYETLLDERIANAVNLGILPEGTSEAPWPSHVQPWTQLNTENKATQAKTMEIYAAVVERMDFHLGRVMSYLRDSGQLDNTLVVFMSDNGADGSDRSKLEGNDTWLPAAWDLSFENMGKVGSYVYPGAAWAQTSVGPHRMYKEFLSQGGIKSPLIISSPTQERSGLRQNSFTTVKDITPTILEFTGIQHPGTHYKEKTIAPIEGESLLAHLSDQTISDSDKVMGWELFGQKAIRKGDWKLLWLSSKPGWLVKPDNADQWGLYNLSNDPSETNNLAKQQPEKFAEMLQLWESYSKDNAVILPEWQQQAN
jgi:arylsulfatase